MAYQAKVIKAEDPSVTKLYGERTVATSCQYFIKYVTKTSNILDVGCGPGIITSDLAKIASDGKTIGLDNSAGIIAEASTSFPPSAVPNLTFTVGDANKLDFPDNTFDIVHAHALLVHVPDPITVLKEFHRVCKPGGIIVCRESIPSKIHSLVPDLPSIRQYWDRAMIAMAKMGGNPDAGAKLSEWARTAGFEENGGKVVASKTPQWNPSHLHRTIGVPAEQAIAYGLCTKEEMEDWRKGWEEWEAFEGAEFVFEAGEIVCWKGADV